MSEGERLMSVVVVVLLLARLLYSVYIYDFTNGGTGDQQNVSPKLALSSNCMGDITYFVLPITLDVNGLSRSEDVATRVVGYSNIKPKFFLYCSIICSSFAECEYSTLLDRFHSVQSNNT